MDLLTLDFETHDPKLKEYGMGWAFGRVYPEYPFYCLGFAYIDKNNNIGYSDDFKLLDELLKTHDAILCHNSTYDLGCLLHLVSMCEISFNMRDHMKFDTMILAKLYNQNFPSYGLDNLAKFFRIGQKNNNVLLDFAWSSGLYAQEKKKETGRNTHTRPSDSLLEKFCKKNLALFPFEIVSEYAKDDVRITKALFDELYPQVDYIDLELYSDLQNIVVESKARGVRIDLERCREVSSEFEAIQRDSEQKLYKLFDKEINLNSVHHELAPALKQLGYNIPKTEKGNYSVTADWLKEQHGEAIEEIKRYRQALKMRRDFIDKMLKYQEAVPERCRNNKYGVLFPTMKILGATKTGRFTSGGGSGCKEVNIQQIPSRNKEFGRPCRSVFLPHKGETWGYGDFNSQESRIQVHYAYLLKCRRVEEVVKAWNDDAMMSFHDKVSELAEIDRTTAKMINLGLSYGMGLEKLIESLGLDQKEGKKLVNQYHRLVPFMSQLQKIASDSFKKNKYIKTIGGRKIRLPREQGGHKDGLSRLVQGSAADQCKRAMQLAYKAGIKIMFAVHDELNFTTSDIDKDLVRAQEAMESGCKLVVPVVAEMGKGNNWLEAKES